MYANPASTVNQVYRWDVSLLGFQATIANSAFVNYNSTPFSTSLASAKLTNGLQPRYFNADVDVNLLNARYKINSNNAVAIGLRLRSYNHFKTSAFNYSDTITSLQSFLHTNNTVEFLDGYGVHAGWSEFNANYSHIVFQSQSSLLSTGITLSYIKSLSGAFVVLSHMNYIELPKQGNDYYYILNQAAVTAAYSENYTLTNANNTAAQNLHNFISKAPSSLGIDIGAEYLIKDGLSTNDKNINAGNYDWKIGVSIMDIGHNKFNPIQGSFKISSPLDFEDTTLQQKLKKVKNIQDVRDSLSTLFGNAANVQKMFAISLPTRLIVSIDHNLGNHFFVNGQLSLNFYSTTPAANLHTRELNLLTVTPRWETQAWGIYMPVQYNAEGQFWVGAAIKLGPLLMGVHSLDIVKWFKTGDQTYNGGGYILLSIHPFTRTARQIKDLDCPRK